MFFLKKFLIRSVHHLHKFDKLRFEFNNKQNPSQFPHKILNKENIGLTQIYSKSPLLLNVVTCQSIDYNDLVVKTFSNAGTIGSKFISSDMNPN